MYRKGIAMTHTKSGSRSTSPDRKARDDRSLLETPGTKWRSALGALAAAPLRLHRYRNFHTEVVEDAIRAYDRSKCI